MSARDFRKSEHIADGKFSRTQSNVCLFVVFAAGRIKRTLKLSETQIKRMHCAASCDGWQLFQTNTLFEKVYEFSRRNAYGVARR